MRNLLLVLVLAGVCVGAEKKPDSTQLAKNQVESLYDKDNDVRRNAARSLGSIGPEALAAVPRLTESLKDKHDTWVPHEAAWALGQIGGAAQTAVPALVELIKKDKNEPGMIAVQALGGIGPTAKPAIPILIKSLTDESRRLAAAESLGRIGPEAKIAVPELIKLLKVEDRWFRAVIVRALGRIGPEAVNAVPALAGLLKGDNGRDAAWALVEIGPGSKAATPILVELLKDESHDWTTRQIAALALAKIGASSIPPLMGFLHDKSELLQWLAVGSLGAMGPEARAAVPSLIELLNGANVSLRLCIVQSLGEIGPQAETAAPALTRLLQDEDPLVRRAAIPALVETDYKARRAVVVMLMDKCADVRDVADSVLDGSSLETRMPGTDAKKIRGLIADLAKIRSPDYGLSPTLTGDAFAPIPSSGHFGMGLLTQHGLQRDSAFTALVELGPKALPLLLESLDDKTPTKLTIKHDFGMGGMWFGHEIGGSVFNKQERKVLSDVDDDWSFINQPDYSQYTVKVGDVCFVIIGQITNRSYNAVRYQPTACIVLNSTARDKKLADEVRAIWGKGDYRQKLLDSLLIDFDGRDDTHDGAAMRLAYYFPDASVGLIVARLKELDSLAMDRGLLKAVSWSSQPRINAAVLDIFRKTKDTKALLAALPGLGNEHDELVFSRLTKQLAGFPTDEPGPYSDGYYLLIALANRFPDRAEAVFRNFLKPGTIERRLTAAHALQETCGHLAIKLLTPLLDDEREVGWDYAVNPKQNEPRLPIRVCDEAAATIAMHSKTLGFEMKGTHDDLDRQIEAMRQKIAEMKGKKGRLEKQPTGFE